MAHAGAGLGGRRYVGNVTPDITRISSGSGGAPSEPGRFTGPPEAALLVRLCAMGEPVTDELQRLRMSIDNMDAALVHLLAERFKITQQVGELKAAHGLPPADPAREAQQIERLRALAEDARLDPEFAEKFLNFVVAEVVRHHKAAVLNQNASSDP